MNSKKTLLIIAFSGLLIACSKFEDGPAISFRSVMKRIYGTYKIEYFSKNGTDLTSYWDEYYDLKFRFYEWDRSSISIAVNVSGYIDSCGHMKHYATDYECFVETGKNAYIAMKNYIIDTTLFPNRCLYPILITTSDNIPAFNIVRLTQNEMWLTHTQEQDFYEIHFKE